MFIGDTGQASSRKNSLDQSFVLAVKQAEEAFKIIKSKNTANNKTI